MQSKHIHWRLMQRIAAKEITLFFASPIAYLFLLTFAAVTLFVFFWGEAFFSRNIADVRPLFEWMPVLLIFLASTLTMRLWSEERRTGTLEYILTQPVALWHFVVGKYLGCLVLLAIALLVTLPLPMTVAGMANLDWGPVFAGYLATFLLGAAYMSIGLFISARSENQIVSLISATFVCSLLYLIGTSAITDFFGNQAGEWLRALGTGARFDAITRGVIDFRDLYYYFSIVAVFLSLNTYVLEKERWASTGNKAQHKIWQQVTGLLVINALAANLWLGQVHLLRVDATEGNQYSISDATQGYLDQLQEPLLLRGYFSSKTHPLLAPLVPQLKDLMEEYQVAGRGQVKVEFVDPASEPELEQEANQKYGIQPVPFQVADRYQASIVSSYFNVLVQYGDEYQVLSFRDLIEVQARSEADIDVQLRNPEHDLTRAVKKVLNAYQADGNLFDTLKGKIEFAGYISGDEALPDSLQAFKAGIENVLEDVELDAGDRFSFRFINPDEEGVDFKRKLLDDYGFQPMSTNLLSNERFYFYLTLSKDGQMIQVPMGDLSEGEFQRNLEAGIKRFASGFTKTVAWVAPTQTPNYGNPYAPSGPQYKQLEAFLGTDLNVVPEDLSDGTVNGAADILVVVAPEALSEKALFAVDQYLMQGGTLVLATSPYSAEFANRSLSMKSVNSGLSPWLKHLGIEMDASFVLDPQSTAFPVPVTRQVGAFQFQEMKMLDYPYFVDVRSEGLNGDNPMVSELPHVTMPWASPIQLNQEKLANYKVTELLRSSPDSWTSSSTDVVPRMTASGVSSFEPEGEPQSQLLGAMIQGRFDSYFSDKDSPLLANEVAETASKETADQDAAPSTVVNSIIKRSPESARIILFSSNDFLRDQVMRLAGSAQQSEYLSGVQLIANAVDWSLEDAGLLSIRGRGHFNRTLPPMEQGQQMIWEYVNYGLALIMIALIAFLQKSMKVRRERQYHQAFVQQ